MTKSILIFDPNGSGPSSGAPMRTFKLAKLLAKAGREVTFFTSRASHMRLNTDITEDVKSGVRFKVVHSPVLKFRKMNLRLVNLFIFQLHLIIFIIIRMLIGSGFSVVINATNLPIFFPVNLMVKYIGNSRLIVEVRDLFPLTLFENFLFARPLPIRAFVIFITKLNFIGADTLVTTIKGADNYYRTLNVIDSKNVVYINNFFHEIDDVVNIDNRCLAIMTQISERYGVVIGYAGSMRRSNGIELFLSLAKLLSSKDVAFVFLGNGPKSELICNDRYPHVYYLGHVNYQSARKVIEMFDYGLVGGKRRPSHRYGVSQNKLFEYAGLNVKILNIVDTKIKLFIRDKEIWYLPIFNAAELSQEITKIIKSDASIRMLPKDGVLLEELAIKEDSFLLSYLRVIDA
jgi:hypothetical protein